MGGRPPVEGLLSGLWDIFQGTVVAVLKGKRTRSCKKLVMNETMSACQPGLTSIRDARLDFDTRRTTVEYEESF